MSGGTQSLPPVARWVVGAAVAGTVLIGLGAFWLSFLSLSDLATRAGINIHQSWVWPLIVDGINVVATISVLALIPHGRRATFYPWSLLIASTLVSVAANMAHSVVAADASVPVVFAACVAAVQLAITHLTVELIRRTLPFAPAATATAPVLALQARSETVPVLVSAKTDIDRRAEARALRAKGWSNRRVARELGVHPSTVGRWFQIPEVEPGTKSSAIPDEREAVSTQ